MKRVRVVRVALLTLLLSLPSAARPFDRPEDHAIASTTITILYDDNPFAGGLTAEWGSKGWHPVTAREIGHGAYLKRATEMGLFV